MTLRDVTNAIRGYHEREERRMRHDYEVMRYQTAVLLSPYTEKGKNLSPQDVLRFTDEAKKEKEKPLITKQDIDIMDRWDREYAYIPNPTETWQA
jgi:hypothetical protein